jgi:hypothetical protein|tara:strand:- start:1376 stop:1624 length:249 start_codon:yes stop_codon:yes gene_type:complete
MVDIRRLTVETDDQRIEWLKILSLLVEYHRDIAEQFKPVIIGGDASVYRIHTAWAHAVEDAMHLIETWEVDEEVISTPGPAG